MQAACINSVLESERVLSAGLFVLHLACWPDANIYPFVSCLISPRFVPSCVSILGMHLFGCKFGSEGNSGDTMPDRKNFDSLLWAIVTVFQVSICPFLTLPLGYGQMSCSIRRSVTVFWITIQQRRDLKLCIFMKFKHCLIKLYLLKCPQATSIVPASSALTKPVHIGGWKDQFRLNK